MDNTNKILIYIGDMYYATHTTSHILPERGEIYVSIILRGWNKMLQNLVTFTHTKNIERLCC